MISAFALMAFGAFAVGFFIGYKREDKKALRRKRESEIDIKRESEEERKSKKEWKKFLEYDGSTLFEEKI